MLDTRALIQKHNARGVFIDTNLLVLLLVGLVNVGRIRTFKRTQNFTVDDFHLLRKLVEWFGAPLLATPHVLSQVSDLTDLSGQELVRMRQLFRSLIGNLREHYDVAQELINNPLFERFGLADASIAAACERKILVLTTDLQLHIALGSSGFDALNFTHVRPLQELVVRRG
jgi:hypothetical protein